MEDADDVAPPGYEAIPWYVPEPPDLTGLQQQRARMQCFAK